MSESRLAIVKRAWAHVSNGAASVSLDSLCKAYNANAHPRVVARERLAQNVADDFHKHMGEKAVDGQVSEEKFVDYYTQLNMVLPAEREAYFCDIVVKTWGLNANIANVHSTRIAQIEDIIFEKIRQRTHGADDEGKTAKRIFKHFDLDGFGTIEMKEFSCALETIGCVFPAHEMAAIFNKIDRNCSGKIDYEEFANWFALKGSGNNPNVNPVFGLTREPPHAVLDKIRNYLTHHKSEDFGIRKLGNLFRKMD